MSATLAGLLPPARARILDVGTGTGFLSLAAARLGHEVTALDISSAMLERLRRVASEERLPIRIVCGAAHEPPSGPVDVVVERLALWTLPDPTRALAAWRGVATGSLVAFEGLWTNRDYVEGVRRRGRALLRRVHGHPPEHHAASPELQAALPPTSSVAPSAMIELIEAGGWQSPKLIRLRDVEWARGLALPPLDRLAGVTPEYAITAS